MIYKELMFERQRLIIPPGPQSKPTGLGTVRFIGSCSSSAKEIVEKAKTVLTLINHYYDKEWPYLDTWRTILPTDFVNQFRPEKNFKRSMLVKHYMN